MYTQNPIVLIKKLQRQLCPRVHFKMDVFDYREVYVRSANLTGAGIGARRVNKRNFEAGVLTDDFEILDAACNQFDDVWIGGHCKKLPPQKCLWGTDKIEFGCIHQNTGHERIENLL